MKQIIKKGTKTTYYKTCLNCGCEFSYNFTDTENGIVTCPDCGAPLIHQTFTATNISEQDMYKFIPKPLDITYNQCLNCPHYKALQEGITYVGDSPCTWCRYNLCQGGTNTVC